MVGNGLMMNMGVYVCHAFRSLLYLTYSALITCSGGGTGWACLTKLCRKTPLFKGVKGLTPMRSAIKTQEGVAAAPHVMYLWHRYCASS